MASAVTTEMFECTPEQFFAILKDYENYPKFLNEVKGCKIIETKGNQKLVEYDVSVIKSFKYRLWMTEEPGKRLSWTFDSGDLFKTSTGSWDLTAKGNETQAVYSVDATFRVFVPGPVAKALVNVNLPAMMRAYHNRIKELYG